MIYFNCDYNEGAHEKIMQRLLETNMEQTPGYGCDVYCERASTSSITFTNKSPLSIFTLFNIHNVIILIYFNILLTSQRYIKYLNEKIFSINIQTII